jgi:hypothetical protein
MVFDINQRKIIFSAKVQALIFSYFELRQSALDGQRIRLKVLIGFERVRLANDTGHRSNDLVPRCNPWGIDFSMNQGTPYKPIQYTIRHLRYRTLEFSWCGF